MAESKMMLDRTLALCVTCANGARSFGTRYREFILAPATLFTFASGMLLIAAAIQQPLGLVSSREQASDSTPLYLVAAFVGSVFIWWSALQGIRRRDFTADIPVSIATIAAILIGQYSAAAVVAVLLLLGGMLENFVAARAGRALDALATLLPDQVTVRRDGRDLSIPLAEVQTGDLLLIRSGERIAVDGEIASGYAAINQAAITGESLPVDKKPGDTVYAGTLNASGALEVRAAKVGEETTLGQIRRLIEQAQTQKAPIERLLDRYAKLYTPAALVLGALVWWWSGDLLRAITILIVFCPCVMVLPTPTALVASIGNAALRGSLVKKGATVEALARVDTVIFDKTGTLTLGTPKLIGSLPLNGVGERDLSRLAAIAEKFREHPLGRAVVQAAAALHLVVPDPQQFEPLAGLGVCAQSDGLALLLGRGQLLHTHGILSVVSYALHDLVCEWMAREVIAFERLVSVREQFNAVLSGSNQRLREQADHLHRELDRVGKQIGHLLTAIERGGWTEEIQERLVTRKREKLQVETDLAGIEQKLKMGNLKVSDEVLRYMADHFAEALASRHPDYARRLIQMVVPKAELYKEKLRLHYTPEILMETLTLSAAQGITGLWTVPPWELEGSISHVDPV